MMRVISPAGGCRNLEIRLASFSPLIPETSAVRGSLAVTCDCPCGGAEQHSMITGLWTWFMVSWLCFMTRWGCFTGRGGVVAAACRIQNTQSSTHHVGWLNAARLMSHKHNWCSHYSMCIACSVQNGAHYFIAIRIPNLCFIITCVSFMLIIHRAKRKRLVW